MEKIELGGGARHEQINNAFGIAEGGWLFRREGIGNLRRCGCHCRSIAEQRSQRHRAEPDATLAEKPAARDQTRILGSQILLQIHKSALLILSHRLAAMQIILW